MCVFRRVHNKENKFTHNFVLIEENIYLRNVPIKENNLTLICSQQKEQFSFEMFFEIINFKIFLLMGTYKLQCVHIKENIITLISLFQRE